MEGRRVAWDMQSYVTRVRAACFVCELIAGTPGYDHEVIWRDDTAVVFPAEYPVVWGHVLVVPVEHREHAIGDFSLDEYLHLQGVVHRAGTMPWIQAEFIRLAVGIARRAPGWRDGWSLLSRAPLRVVPTPPEHPLSARRECA